MAQILVALLSVLAVGCSQSKNYKKYACLFGLASQPFWFYIGVVSGQWAIAMMCFVYGACWYKGLRVYWYGK